MEEKLKRQLQEQLSINQEDIIRKWFQNHQFPKVYFEQLKHQLKQNEGKFYQFTKY